MPGPSEEASALLKQRYDELALSLDDRTTACDGDTILDVGCGLGYGLRRYASARRVEAHGIDYSANMIAGAQQRMAETEPKLTIEFRVASVLDLPYADDTFDIVTSHRCLMALLDWDLQQKALRELNRVLKPGGKLGLLEGTFEGLERLNELRRRFGLDEIEAAGTERLLTLKFHEAALLAFVEPLYELVRVQRFGTYYLLTRIVQPLLVAPESPRTTTR